MRAAIDTGLANLPLHELDQNRIWQDFVALACEIIAWTQMLALTEHPAGPGPGSGGRGFHGQRQHRR